eukprot:scaffold5702_cov23-Tisochrysis_lutea.AAC.1
MLPALITYAPSGWYPAVYVSMIINSGAVCKYTNMLLQRVAVRKHALSTLYCMHTCSFRVVQEFKKGCPVKYLSKPVLQAEAGAANHKNKKRKLPPLPPLVEVLSDVERVQKLENPVGGPVK